MKNNLQDQNHNNNNNNYNSSKKIKKITLNMTNTIIFD